MTQIIGQYEIRDLLGEGGLGQVHAAFDTVLQRNVAIKSLRPELLNDTNFVDRFRVEATSLARLNHPNITTIYSLIPEGKNLYMVMELVRGHTLDDILKKRNAPIEVRECLAIIAQAADGLSYAHSMGVIHRDIKPANLMVAENGVLKIMDFGIARVRGSQRLTRTGSIVGTLAYMAPEQLRGEEGDESCDLYSLAIVLYEMLSGAPPFSATSEYDLMQAQINQRPDRLMPRVPGLETGVESALMRALSKKPAQRFPSVRAFSDALGASALRLDAPKILHNDTRLLEVPAFTAPIAPPKRSPLDQHNRHAAAVLDAAVARDARRRDGRWRRTRGRAGLDRLPVLAVVAIAAANPGPANCCGQARPAATEGAAVRSPGHARESDAQAAQPGSNTPGAGPTAQPGSAPTSLADIIPAADRGDPAAQNALGLKYAAGADGLPRDETKAVEWYRKAALQGYPAAETNLGDMYLFGHGGLDKNPLEALSWYLKASQQQWPDAEYRLAYMYEVGLGTAKDLQRAAELYQSAANAGYPDAENVLGVLYATGGDGLPKDDQQAIAMVSQGCRTGICQGGEKSRRHVFLRPRRRP